MLRIVRNFYYFLLNQRLILKLAVGVFRVLSKSISILVKPKNNLVVFGGMNGIHYGDNSRFVFEYLVRESSQVECYWLTNNIKVYKDLKDKSLPVALSWTLKGIVKLYQARVGVYSNTLRDISFEPLFVPENIKLIALRHGKSVKRVLYGIKDFEINEKPYRVATIRKEYSQVAFTISSSDFVSKLTEECMRIGIEKHIVTGYPRYDDLIRNSKAEECSLINLNDEKYKQVILYAPTWRNGLKETMFFPFNDFDLDQLLVLLVKYNAVIAVRPHVNDLLIFPNIENYLKKLEIKSKGRIFLASHKNYPDTYIILKKSTILISDYSSIYHDYLLLNRPIFFIAYDYEWFSQKFGFLYDYYKKMPGGKIVDGASLIESLKSAFDGNDDFEKERHSLRDEVHRHKDASSSKRVAIEILKLFE